jgi:hypothetical protein
MGETLGPWAPLGVGQAAALLGALPFPWWIAGGWAIDLAAGRQTRPHADLDILVLRRDALACQAALRGWDLHAADPPGTLRLWRAGEELPGPVHDICCRRDPAGPWLFQLMLGESEGDRWLFRRDPGVTLPLAALGRRTAEGIPYLAPAVQLLFKSRGRRPKDEADCAVALPLLDPEERRWLAAAIRRGDAHHPWLARL